MKVRGLVDGKCVRGMLSFERRGKGLVGREEGLLLRGGTGLVDSGEEI